MRSIEASSNDKTPRIRTLTLHTYTLNWSLTLPFQSAKLLVSLSKAPHLSPVLRTVAAWSDLCQFYTTNFALLRRMPSGVPRYVLHTHTHHTDSLQRTTHNTTTLKNALSPQSANAL